MLHIKRSNLSWGWWYFIHYTNIFIIVKFCIADVLHSGKK